MRLRMLREAGELRIPFTTGILIGIGETLAERVDTPARHPRPAPRLRPHPGSHRPELPRQADASRWPTRPSPSAADMARTIAVARLMLGPT